MSTVDCPEKPYINEIETVDQFMNHIFGIVTQFQTYGEAIEQIFFVQM